MASSSCQIFHCSDQSIMTTIFTFGYSPSCTLRISSPTCSSIKSFPHSSMIWPNKLWILESVTARHFHPISRRSIRKSNNLRLLRFKICWNIMKHLMRSKISSPTSSMKSIRSHCYLMRSSCISEIRFTNASLDRVKIQISSNTSWRSWKTSGQHRQIM